MKKIFVLIIIGLLSVASTPNLAEQSFKLDINQQDDDSNVPWDEQKYDPLLKPSFVPSELVINFKTKIEKSMEPISKDYVTTGLIGIDVLNKKFKVTSIEKVIDDDTIEALTNCYLFHLSNETDINYAASQYAKIPQVSYAEPNYLFYHCMMPNDPYFGLQWALHNTGQTGGKPDADIDAPEAWDLETGDPGVVIAVVDTGLDYTNPDSGNYTATEEPYVIETSHPLNFSVYKKTLTFPEVDQISFHITKFDVLLFPGFIIKSALSNKLIPKKLFSAFLYNGTGSNVWSRYSEISSSNNIIIQAGGEGRWGFAIDKVKKLVWRQLSQMSPRLVDGYDFYYNNADPMDDFGHGTFCAGIAAAETNNSQGIAGIAYGCKIMPVKVGGSSALGALSLIAATRGIVFAVNHGADIISMSFGGGKTRTMNLALNYASSKDVILVASAGNSNINDAVEAYPAGHPDVIAVAATDQNDSKAYFSNFGSWVDVAAPGVDIVSLHGHGTDMYLMDTSAPPGSHFIPPFDENAIACLASGTSMSCPLVAGVAGLILSKNPNLSAKEVRTILRSSTDSVNSFLPVGTGRINAYNALVKTEAVIAELDSSLDDEIIKGNVEIKGIAKGIDFSSFDIDYAFGVYPTDDQWVQLAHSTTPAEGKLAQINADTLKEGLYTIRLLVNASGFIYKDIVFVVVDNQQNTFYVDNENVDGPWYGTENDPFISIQYAIECCGPRDDVRVASGVYKEVISIYKNKFSIHGEDKANTIIDPSGEAGVSMSSVRFGTLEGFTITNCSYAVAMISCKGNKIYNNRFTNSNLCGIAMMLCRGNILYENEFINNPNHTFGMYNLNLWYNPLKLRGNYWDDYEERYPNARQRIPCPWSWSIPYKIMDSFFLPLLEIHNISTPPFFRFLLNNDRFPLINPT